MQPTLEVSEAEFDRVFNVNMKSIFWSVKTIVPHFKKQGRGGSIVNISSIGAERPRPGLVYYNASKGAVSNVRRTHYPCSRRTPLTQACLSRPPRVLPPNSALIKLG